MKHPVRIDACSHRPLLTKEESRGTHDLGSGWHFCSHPPFQQHRPTLKWEAITSQNRLHRTRRRSSPWRCSCREGQWCGDARLFVDIGRNPSPAQIKACGRHRRDPSAFGRTKRQASAITTLAYQEDWKERQIGRNEAYEWGEMSAMAKLPNGQRSDTDGVRDSYSAAPAGRVMEVCARYNHSGSVSQL